MVKARKGRNRWSRAWLVYLVSGVFATVAYFFLPSSAAQDTLRPLFNLAALGAFVAGILVHRPKRPLPWYLFTFGMLLIFKARISPFIVLVPFLWSLIGMSAAVQLGMYEDFGLFVAGIAGSAMILLRNRRLKSRAAV